MGRKSDLMKTPKQQKIAGPLSARKAKTPDANARTFQKLKKTPNSAPHMKRKKLAEEIDEQISDEEFELAFEEMKAVQKNKKTLGRGTPKSAKKTAKKAKDSEEDTDDDSDESFDIENGQDGTDDEEDDSLDEEDVEDDDDDDESDEDDDVDSSEMANMLKELSKNDSDEDDDNDDDDDDDDEEEEKVSAANKKSEDKSPKRKIEAIKKKTEKQEPPKKKAKQTKGEPGEVKAVVSRKAAQALCDDQVNRDRRTLFIKNLPTDVKESEIKEVAPACTEITIKLMRDKKLANRGFALVEFKTEAAADTHYKKLDKTKVRGNKLVVDYVGTKSILRPTSESDKTPKPEELDPLKLYVRGLSNTVTEETLKSWFPEAIDVGLPRKLTNNKPCGFGFIHFKSPKLCSAALRRVNGQVVDGKTINVYHAKKKSLKRLTKVADAQKKMAEAKKCVGSTMAKKAEKGTKPAKNATKGVKHTEMEVDSEESGDDDDDDLDEDENSDF